jgi:hypothetical protein
VVHQSFAAGSFGMTVRFVTLAGFRAAFFATSRSIDARSKWSASTASPMAFFDRLSQIAAQDPRAANK